QPVNLGLANIAASLICSHPRAIARGAPNRQITSREDPLWRYGRLDEREVSMRASESTTAYGRLPRPQGPALAQFHSDPALHMRREVHTSDADERFVATRNTEPARATPIEISFGPFRLLPTQFLLLEDERPVSLGSRALEILTVLLERPGKLVSKQELMARV